jgi:hypothetical protein
MTKARSNAVANAAKGDLTVGNGTDLSGILAVGSNGDTLVADSSTSTGLRYGANFAAGKNKIINGDFNINQRSFTSTTADSTYGFDRWIVIRGGGTVTYSAQTFTLGAAPVAGYEAKNFARVQTTGQTATSTYTILQQRIEDVRTFAGQTVTVSFWAKANSGTPKVAVEMEQQFGSGGSPSSSVTAYAGQVTLSTSWARYSVTVAVPSISGKTLGTNNDSSLNLNLWISAGSDFNSRSGSLGIQTNTFDFWGVQAEAGSVATAFQTATGTLQGELAACQRYYYFSTQDISFSGNVTSGSGYFGLSTFPVTMRVAPTMVLTNVNATRFPSTAGSAYSTMQYFRELRTANTTGDANFGSTYTASAEL